MDRGGTIVLVLTDGAARDLIADALAAVHGPRSPRAALLERLDGLSADDLLRLDGLARTFSEAGAEVRGTALAAQLRSAGDPLAPVVASLHADGHLREWAVQRLRRQPGALATACLAVRCLDHVPQVREAARRAVAARPVDEYDRVLAVLLAGASRLYAEDVLEEVAGRLVRERGVEAARRLRGARDARLHRWAYQRCLADGLLDRFELRAALRAESDQVVQGWCAKALAGRAEPDDVAFLLESHLAAARLAVLDQVPEGALNDVQVLALLEDGAASVRRSARWRARRRGLDDRQYLRDRLRSAPAPRRIVACLDGLSDGGADEDLPLVSSFLTTSSPRVRAAAVAAASRLAAPRRLADLLGPLLLDPSPRVAGAAARALVHARETRVTAWIDRAWASPFPSARGAAWMVSRAGGSWERVEADLRAAADEDGVLASHGRAALRNWLIAGAATTYGHPSTHQADRMNRLLTHSGLTSEQIERIGFHAGLPHPNRDAAAGARPKRSSGAGAVGRLAQRLVDRSRRQAPGGD